MKKMVSAPICADVNNKVIGATVDALVIGIVVILDCQGFQCM
jgi:hypothetical protein